jgi:hypothetical protein
MTGPSCAYATDEDIALRASADFAILCPKDQCLAYGTDGSFGTDPWTLQSSVDFSGNGVVPGQVVRLTQPTSAYKPPGEAFVVDSATAGALVLRRKGLPSGAGQPAGPAGGVSGVEFTVTTLGPQIARASYDLNRRFGIDNLVAGRRPSDLFDPREVRDVTVLTVLYRQYLELSRGTPERADSFVAKSQAYKQELDDALDRLVVHWSALSGAANQSPGTTRLSTRISR